MVAAFCSCSKKKRFSLKYNDIGSIVVLVEKRRPHASHSSGPAQNSSIRSGTYRNNDDFTGFRWPKSEKETDFHRSNDERFFFFRARFAASVVIAVECCLFFPRVRPRQNAAAARTGAGRVFAPTRSRFDHFSRLHTRDSTALPGLTSTEYSRVRGLFVFVFFPVSKNSARSNGGPQFVTTNSDRQ